MTKLEQQYAANVQAYKDLGLAIPASLAEVKTKLSKPQKTAITKGTGQLVLAPAITKDFTFKDLLAAYKSQHDLWVWDALWDQYDFTGTPACVTVVDLTAGNNYEDPVTQHTNLTIEEQRKLTGEFLGPVEAVILNLIFIQQNTDLAPSTWIRFPQLENKTVDGYSVVGYVDSDDGQLLFDGTHGRAVPSGGVGLSVGPKIPLSPLASSLSSSLEAPDFVIEKLVVNGRTYVLEDE